MRKNKFTTVVAVMVAATILMTGCGKDTGRNSDEVLTDERDSNSMVHLENADEVSAFFDEVYSTVSQDILPMGLTTTELDIDDSDTVGYHTGLSDMTGIEGISLSESMIGSIAYSAVYIRTNDEADIEKIRQDIFDYANPAKWICVTAEKEIAANFGGDVFFIMGPSETVDAVYQAATAVAKSRGLTVSDTVLEKMNPV